MYLNKHEEALLDGEQGVAPQLAMKILTRLGDIYGAKKMIPIASAHVLGHYGSLHDAGIDVIEKFAEAGGKFKVQTTVDPASMDLERWREFRVPEEYAKKQIRLCEALRKMEVMPIWDCTPYLHGNIPRFGQQIAWAESSAVSFSNSIIGARTNRISVGVDISASIAGRIPETGLHLKENRYGDIIVKMKRSEYSEIDYNTIGYLIGKVAKDQIPIFADFPIDATIDQLKNMGAAAASSGSVSIYHIVGLTPEARTLKEALGEKPPTDKIELGIREIEKAQGELSTIAGGRIDLVAVGCPHYSVEQIKKLALLLKGKKVHRNTEFWIYVSKWVAELSRRMGFSSLIEAAGARILTQTCLVICPITTWGFDVIMTDSAKYANVLPSEHKVDVIYASIENCVKAAIAGRA